MVAQPSRQPNQREQVLMSVEDYLTLDRNSPDTRYEYIDGSCYMMAGGTNNHSKIGTNITTALSLALRGTPWSVYNSDVYVEVNQQSYVHPDATVSCSEGDEQDNERIRHPRVIVEVLSPSTEAIDRGKKLKLYRSLPTLEEYVLVESEQYAVELYRRAGEIWTYHTFGPGEQVILTSIDIRIPVEALYEKVRFYEQQP